MPDQSYLQGIIAPSTANIALRDLYEALNANVENLTARMFTRISIPTVIDGE
jgi:hypothetical protein